MTPVYLSIVFLLFLVWWVFSFAMLFSAGKLRHDEGDIFGDMTWEPYVQWGVYLTAFALIWFIFFILATNIFVVSAMCASWYFRKKGGKGINFKTALTWAWVWHTGSLALGSFLISLLWVVQLVLSYIYQKTKDSNS